MKKRLISLLILAITITMAGASQVNWRAQVSGAKLLSTGEPIGAGFIFELGAFSNNFVPNRENFASWRQNFQALESTAYDSSNGIFAASTDVNTNGTPFGIGQPGYIWGSGASGETILLTASTWTWPSAAGAPGFPVNFFTSDSATIAIVGMVSNEEGAAVHLMTERPGAVIPSSYNVWLARFFNSAERENPAISGPGADADSDGSPNLYEFALSTDPRDPGSALPIQISQIGDVTTLSIEANVRNDVNVSVESSDALTIWTRDSAFMRDASAGTLLFQGVSPNRFFRLRFSF